MNLLPLTAPKPTDNLGHVKVSQQKYAEKCDLVNDDDDEDDDDDDNNNNNNGTCFVLSPN
jgi:hypothetical protein